MNLRDRIGKWVLVLAAPFFLQCENTNQIGAELNPNDEKLNIYYKEFVLPASVIISDSIITSNAERLLVGVFDDPIFGKIKATSFTQLGVNAGSLFNDMIQAEGEFDSAVMYLHIDWFYGNDFNRPQRVRIVELEDTLFSNIFYKSTRQTDLSTSVVGELDISVNPILDSLSQVRLSDAFGSKLFALLEKNDTGISTSSIFQNDVKGLAFIPDDNMEYIVGVERTFDGDTLNAEEESFIRLFYHNDLSSYIFDVTLKGNARYVKLETDKSNSTLSGLSEPYVDYGDINGQVFIQPGTGVFAKIIMDRLWEFADSLEYFYVNQALLEIGPLQSNPGVNIAPQLENISMALASGTNSNKVNGSAFFNNPLSYALLNDFSYMSESRLSPVEIPLAESDMTFRVEVSNYLQLSIEGTLRRTDLMIFPFNESELSGIFDQGQLEQIIFDQGNVKLKLYYTTLR